ncbi:prophage Lp4 protein 7, partial [mine drainage metagenome]
RCNGGYVVAPGSVVEGKLYEIARNLPLAPVPASLLERIEAHRKARRIEHDTEGRMVIEARRRNETLFQIACALRRFGVDTPALLESLRVVNNKHCHPALADFELQTIAVSAARYRPAGEQTRRTNP